MKDFKLLTLIVCIFLIVPMLVSAQSKFDTEFAKSDEWRVIPGEQVGSIKKHTKRADLFRYFDKRLTQDFKDFVNGQTVYKTRIYCETQNSAVIEWTNESMTEVNRVVLEGWIGSRWYTKDGLRVGLKVYDQLLEINKSPLQFYGFFDDAEGGFVSNWKGGSLQKYKDDLAVQIWYSGSCELTELNIYDFLAKKEYSTEADQTKFLEIRVYKLYVNL